MRIGFTGSQNGMNAKQIEKLDYAFRRLTDKTLSIVFHHGDCIGADQQAHDMALTWGFDIVLHPPKDSSKRAYCEGGLVLTEQDYLVRNHYIVDMTEMLIAAPKGPEVRRSGTWATIRYARSVSSPIVLLER